MTTSLKYMWVHLKSDSKMRMPASKFASDRLCSLKDIYSWVFCCTSTWHKKRGCEVPKQEQTISTDLQKTRAIYWSFSLTVWNMITTRRQVHVQKRLIVHSMWCASVSHAKQHSTLQSTALKINCALQLQMVLRCQIFLLHICSHSHIIVKFALFYELL